MGDQDSRVMIKKAEIDTTAPFQSVREAVALFGEKILAGEVYASKLKQVQGEENGHAISRRGHITTELEETRHSLEKAREESMAMENNVSRLKEELERTKMELQQLKQRQSGKQSLPDTDESQTEDVETKFEVKMQSSSDDEKGVFEIQKKRYVTFANPPSVEQMVVPRGVERLERHSNLMKEDRGKKMKKNKKALIPLIGGIFSKKKGSKEAA